MKVTLVLLAFFFINSISSLEAQPARMTMWPGMGMGQWEVDDPQCRQATELNLSIEQASGLEQIQQIYFRETRLLRAQIFLKRLELRQAFTDPSAKIESIRSKYAELLDLKSKLEGKSLEFLMRIRDLLTLDQLNHWCPEREFPSPWQTLQVREPRHQRHTPKQLPHGRWKEK